MRTGVSTVFGTAVVFLVSLAGTRTLPSLHADSLARVEAITSYCEQADPTAESQYAARLAAVLRGHSDDEIQRSRQSTKYQDGKAQANQTLSQVPIGRAAEACSEFLAEK